VMAKLGFGGQWIEIARVGRVKDSAGVERDLTPEWLGQVVANYMASEHDAPAVIGHPQSDTAPAFGWTQEIRLNGDSLEARFADTNDDFEQLVERGSFKKRSSSFYLDPPNLRHVGFLGAQPPAIKGLRDIKFSDGESFALESTFQLQENTMKDTDLDQLPESFWDKLKSKLGVSDKSDLAEGKGGSPTPQPTTVNLTEDGVKSLVAEAVTAAKAEFKEQIDSLTEENKNLKEKVDGQIAGSARAEIVSFVESIPAEKGRHYLKRAGVVEFMEGLAVADAAAGDKKIVSFSEGEGDDKQEHKFSLIEWFKTYVEAQPAFVQFGEKFGSLTASPDADKMVDPAELNKMRDAMGIKNKSAAGGDK
jgi:hypothetical protein